MRKVLFRVDAGPTIGLGHLQRCLSLADALRHLDITSLFLTNDDPRVLERVSGFGFDGYKLITSESWRRADIEQTLDIGAEIGCSAIVVDSDYEGADYLDKLRKSGYFVAAIEDTAPHPFPCHLVVNGDTHARQLRYQSPRKDTQFLLGPEYSILRPEFWDVPTRAISNNVNNILVTFGGADPYNLMSQTLAMLESIPKRFVVTAIIGPFFENFAEIQAVDQGAYHDIRLVKTPDSVSHLMTKADLAISAGGQTLYELACVGCPTVAVKMADNQDGQLATFKESGFLQFAGSGKKKDITERIITMVNSLLTDTETRFAMSKAGQRLIDGKGALRVTQRIVEGIGHHKESEMIHNKNK